MYIKKAAIVTAGCLLAFAMFLGFNNNANAVTSDEIAEQIGVLEEEKAELDKELAALEQAANSNATELIQMVAQKDAIDRQIVIIHQQIDNMNDQIVAYGILIADKQEELTAAEKQLEEFRELSKNRIREMEERGEISYWSVIFEAETFSDLLDRFAMAQELIEADQRYFEKLSQMADAVETAKREMNEKKNSLQEMRKAMAATQTELQEKRNEADGILQKLLATGEEYRQLLQESEDRQHALMEQIAQKENEYDRLAYEEWLATSVPETTPPPTTMPPTPEEKPAPDPATSWMTPVPYYVLTSPFGMRWHPVLGIYRMHNGVDLACATDTPIYASRSGIVTVTAYEEYGAGNYVSINHGDGYKTIYMHMTRYIVAPGDHVEAGQVIGYVGSSGLSDGPHLHFGISYNGTYVNPMEYIG